MTQSTQLTSSDAAAQTGGSYADLKRQIQQAGLLEKQPTFLIIRIIFNLCLLAISINILFVTDRLAIQMLDAVFMAFVSVQISFIIHDTGHRQAFRRTKTNDLVGMVHGNLLWGGSYAWWVEVHNQHHVNPNTPEADPHIDIAVLAFSQAEALGKHGILRFLVRYQAYYVFPIMLFTTLSQTNEGLRYLRDRRWKYRRLEGVLWLAHVVIYCSVLVVALGLPTAVLFMLVHRGLSGLYAASIFAPNHKGMPLIDSDAEIDFLHQQVLTARNVQGGRFVNFWCGGLNYQIEHHLFPTLPRNKLYLAQRIIRQFCASNDIPYYETGLIRSYIEIVQALHVASAPLRRPPLVQSA